MEKKPNEIGDDNEQMIEDNNEDSGHDRVMEWTKLINYETTSTTERLQWERWEYSITDRKFKSFTECYKVGYYINYTAEEDTSGIVERY